MWRASGIGSSTLTYRIDSSMRESAATMVTELLERTAPLFNTEFHLRAAGSDKSFDIVIHVEELPEGHIALCADATADEGPVVVISPAVFACDDSASPIDGITTALRDALMRGRDMTGSGPPILFYVVDPAMLKSERDQICPQLVEAGKVWSAIAYIRFAQVASDQASDTTIHFIVKKGRPTVNAFAKSFFPGDFEVEGGLRELFLFPGFFDRLDNDHQIDVLTHELGHILGFEHSGELVATSAHQIAPKLVLTSEYNPDSGKVELREDVDSIMYTYVAERNHRPASRLSQEEEAAVKLLYGAAVRGESWGTAAKVAHVAVGALGVFVPRGVPHIEEDMDGAAAADHPMNVDREPLFSGVLANAFFGTIPGKR